MIASEQPGEQGYHVETPEQVALSYDVAGLGSRFVAALLDTLLQTLALVLFGFGLVWAAGTLVIKERGDLRQSVLREFGVGATGVEPGRPIENLGRLGASEHGLLRDYLTRRPALAEPAADALARQLAASLANKLGHELES